MQVCVKWLPAWGSLYGYKYFVIFSSLTFQFLRVFVITFRNTPYNMLSLVLSYMSIYFWLSILCCLSIKLLARRRGAMGSAYDSCSVDTCQSWARAPSKGPVVSLSKRLYSNCLVLVGSRNGFERDLHKQKMLVSQSN